MWSPNVLSLLISLLSITLFSQNLEDITIYNTDNSGLIYNQINCLEFDDENRLWIGTENGLSIFHESENTWLNMSEEGQGGLSSNIITALESDNVNSSSTMFIGTVEGITYSFWDSGEFGDDGEGVSWLPNYGSTCNPNQGIIKSILHDNNATQLWSGSTDGLCVEGLVEDEAWLLYNTETGFYSNNITSIKRNPSNNLIQYCP